MTWGAVAVAGASVAGGLISASAAKDAAGKQQAGTDKAVEASQAAYKQTRNDLAPYRTAGNAALARLSALLGIDTSPANGGYNPDDWSTSWHKFSEPAGVWDESSPGYADVVKSTIADLKARGIEPTTSAASTDPEYGSLLKKFSTSDLNADPVYNSGLQFGLNEGEKAINARAIAGGGYDSGATLKALSRYANDYGSTKAAESQARFKGDQDSSYQKLAGLGGMGLSAAGATSSAGTGNASNLANLYSSQSNANAASGIAGGNAIAGGINSGINNYNQYQYLSKLSPGGQRSIDPTVSDRWPP